MSNKANISISLFGSPEIQREGVLHSHFQHRKSIALLVYLAVTQESHSRDHLAGLLWGETSDSNALGGLRKVLAELRDVIGPYLLEHDRQVAFNPDLPSHVDVLDFEQGVSDLVEHRAEMLGIEDTDVLREAAELYTGDFLAGFYVQRAPAFEDWVTLTRERLRLKALDALYLLSKDAYRLSDYSASILYTRRLLALEPCHEEAHRQLMSLLALIGQRDLALEQYETCRNILMATYSIAPQQETIELYERIREESLVSPEKNDFALPVPTAPLIGREADLDILKSRLMEPDCRLLTILGAGGSGKTHLALVLGAKLKEFDPDRYPDGIIFVPLNALRSIDALPSAVAHQLGFHFHKEEAPIEQLSEYLADKCMLLLLDNFEHLLHQSIENDAFVDSKRYPELLTALLRHAPKVDILVTSRVRLNLKEEYVYPLSGIAYPETMAESEPDLESSPSVRLFLQSAQHMASDLAMDEGTLSGIVEICRQVQGMPLGILLAAGWSRLLSPGEIAFWLSSENSLDLLENESSDFPVRQRSLRSVLTYSWKLLSASERSVLAKLAVFSGAFGLEAAQFVTRAGLNDLRSLVDHSLLQRVGTNQFTLHEFTRQYAHEKLANLEEVQERYWAYYAERLTVWTGDIKTERHMKAVKAIDLDIGNVRNAWNTALGAERLEHLDRMIDGLCFYYSWRHYYPEGLRACEQLTAYFQTENGQTRIQNSPSERRLYARTLTWLGTFLPITRADAPLRQAHAILEEMIAAGDDTPETLSALGYTCNEMAQAISQSGNHEEAIGLLKQSMQISERLNDRWLLSDALVALGSQLWDQSQYAAAKEHLKRSLMIQRETGDRRGEASSLVWLGLHSLFLGETEGERSIRQGLAIYQELGEYIKVFAGVELASISLMVVGRYEEAHQLLNEIKTRDAKFVFRQDSLQSIWASVLIHLGEYKEAKQCAEIGLRESRRFVNPFGLGFALVVQGWLALVDGENAAAVECFQESAALCKEHDLTDMYTWGLAAHGLAVYRSGNLPEAQHILATAMQTAAAVHSYVGIAFSTAFSLPIAIDLGGAELAIELCAGLGQVPMVKNSVFIQQMIGGEIELITSELPLKVVQSAQERGKQLQLDEILSSILTVFAQEE